MDRDRFESNSPQEEAMWRAQVLRRTARICSAKAKELERMAKVDGNTPMCDSGTLKDVLKRIDNVMEWRFVNALGEVVLDGDILAESIDCEYRSSFFNSSSITPRTARGALRARTLLSI